MGDTSLEYMKLVQPKKIKISLKPHQQNAIHMMETMEKRRHVQYELDLETIKIYYNFGIYADASGTGKTLSILGLIVRNKLSCSTFIYDSQTFSGTQMLIQRRITRTSNGINVIITNTKEIVSWDKEIRHNTTCQHTTWRSIGQMEDPIQYMRDNRMNILLVSTTDYKEFATRFQGVYWHRVIFDITAHFYITNMPDIEANFMWIIHDNPSPNIHNNGFLKKLMGIPMEFLQRLVIRNPPELVRQSMDLLPLQKHVLRYKSLTGEPQYHPKQIEQLLVERLQKERHKCLMDKNVTGVARINQRIKSVNERMEELATTDCLICLQGIESGVFVGCCNTCFCGRCLDKWLTIKNTCPHCKAVVKPAHILRLRVTDIDRGKYVFGDFIAAVEWVLFSNITAGDVFAVVNLEGELGYYMINGNTYTIAAVCTMADIEIENVVIPVEYVEKYMSVFYRLGRNKPLVVWILEKDNSVKV